MAKETLGSRLAYARDGLRLTQTDLAKQTGLQPSTISHFECDRRVPTLQNLVRIVSVLGCTIDSLVSDLPRIPTPVERLDQVIQIIEEEDTSSQDALMILALARIIREHLEE